MNLAVDESLVIAGRLRNASYWMSFKPRLAMPASGRDGCLNRARDRGVDGLL